jgi:Ca-activated chloride channel homolog
MAGPKIAQARKALLFCIESLNPGDRFQVIQFATDVTPLFTDAPLAANSPEARAAARSFIEGLPARGGTAIDDALRVALEPMKRRAVDPLDSAGRPYVVIFLTDGLPTVGVTKDEQIVRNVEKAMSEQLVRIFCFGIGHDVNTFLLDRIALQTRAVSQYVLPQEDIEVKVSNFYARINDPVLADVKLSFGENVRVGRMYPSPLPDLFMGDQLVMFGRYSGGGPATITLSGSVNNQPRTYTFEASFAGDAGATEADAFIPRLWATRRVGFLLDQIRLHGENAELRDEVAQLARDYGIVTPYTSYLILEDEAHRGVPVARRTLQYLEGGGRGAIGGGGGPAAPAQRAAARESYERFRSDRAGDSAVSGAQSNAQLRGAGNLGDLDAANAYARGIAAAAPQQQVRLVRGRAFHQNLDLWVDANIQAAPEDAPRVQVVFDSDEYYDLLRSHPDAAAWLSLGRNVQVLIDEIIYEVIDEEPS